MIFDSVAFVATLKVWRKMHDLTLKDVSDLSQIAYSTLGFILSGDRVPSIAEFVHLCNVMDFDPKDFFRKAQRNDE